VALASSTDWALALLIWWATGLLIFIFASGLLFFYLPLFFGASFDLAPSSESVQDTHANARVYVAVMRAESSKLQENSFPELKIDAHVSHVFQRMERLPSDSGPKYRSAPTTILSW